MLDSTLELITQAASNSLFIFCCCNLIILVIVVGSKSASDYDQETEIPVLMPTATYTCTNMKQGRKTSVNETKVSSKGGISLHTQETPTTGENDSGDADDELRRRVEEFIEKVNKGWKAESRRSQVEQLEI